MGSFSRVLVEDDVRANTHSSVLTTLFACPGDWELGVGRLDAQFGWLPAPAEDAPPVRVVLAEDICKDGHAVGAGQHCVSSHTERGCAMSELKPARLCCPKPHVDRCSSWSMHRPLVTDAGC
jgi:hypothetical protein